ncbi:MAG TPA: hypothetical protein VM427_09700 [Patescibacteria group bacterium]|nr:hypothetical protein [Patescibacteria group bacterium]
MTEPVDPFEPPPVVEVAPERDAASSERRPWLERIGLAAVAAVMGALFSLVAVAAGAGGEWILAAMSAIGAFMTLAVGLATLVRG